MTLESFETCLRRPSPQSSGVVTPSPAVDNMSSAAIEPRISGVTEALGGVEDVVTIVIKTLLRPRSLRRSIRSIRKRFPRIAILVADDSGYRSLEHDLDLVTAYYPLPRDSGASYGRNFLVQQVETPYVMVVDDDTLFDDDTHLEAAWQVLETTPELDLVAGFYRPARWWGCFEVDSQRGVLTQVFEKYRTIVGGFPVYDFVPQFYVARTDSIRAIGWDDELKTLDHLQFFWRARGRLNATVLPYFSAFNTSERNSDYDAFRWQRVPFYRRLQLRKLGLRGIEDVVSEGPLEDLDLQLDERALQAPPMCRPQPTTRTLVIGLGTGRCGTVSLSQVLRDAFGNAPISHERPPLLPWNASQGQVTRHLDRLAESAASVFGDMAFYYLPHVEAMFDWARKHHIRLRFVCMRRPRQATIDSYVAKVASYNANHWVTHDGSCWAQVPEWDACYPKFDQCENLEEALGAYWDLYYETTEDLALRHPEAFRVFDLEVLNEPRGLANLVQFVAPTGSSARPVVGVRLNTADTTHALARRRQEAHSLPIWYLNLDRSADRRHHIEEQVRSVGARSWCRIPGIDGRSIDDSEEGTIDGIRFKNLLGARTPRADLATLLSHLRAARRLLASPNLEKVCVVEDDMVFEGFESWPGHRLSDLMAAVPADWNILQLQCCNTDVLHWLAFCRQRCAFIRREAIDPVFKVWGAGAYLLSRRGAQALMDRFWRHDHFVFDNAPFLAVERLLYDIPGVYVATDAFFVPNEQPSLIAPHHDAVDRAAAELTQRLFVASLASEAGGPMVIYLATHRWEDETIHRQVDQRLADLGVGPRHRVRLRAIASSDLEDSSEALRRGEVWGIRYKNRCREPGERRELARLLSIFKAAFFVDRVDGAGALVLEPGIECERLPELLACCDDVESPMWQPDGNVGAFWLSAQMAQGFLAKTWKEGCFVLQGDRPSHEELLSPRTDMSTARECLLEAERLSGVGR